MSNLPPPGPRGVMGSTIAMARRPYSSAQRWRDEYGRNFMIRVATGTYMVTGDPDVIRDVFRTEPAQLLPGGTASIGPLAGPRSLFVLDPQEHLRERRLLAPPFQGNRMRAYAETIREATEYRIARFEPGERRFMLDEARQISAEVIVRAVFGVRERARLDSYLKQISAWVDAWTPLFILVPAAQKRLWGLSPWARFVDHSDALDRMILQDISARRESGARGDDILSSLLDTKYEDGTSPSNDSLLSHLRTLLFAGHETTMIGIAWVLHYLLRDPERMERTQAVVERPLDELLGDPWLDAVVLEALRIYPIILGVVRNLAADTALGPYTAPRGTNVWVSIAMLHSDPDLYPEPLAFRPERFLQQTPKPYIYAPFGGGHRRCLGAAFAQFEMKIATATLLRRLRLEALGPANPGTVRRNLSMAPKGRVPVRVAEVLS